MRPISVLSDVQLVAPCEMPYDRAAKASGLKMIPSRFSWLVDCFSTFGSLNHERIRLIMPTGMLIRKIQRHEWYSTSHPDNTGPTAGANNTGIPIIPITMVHCCPKLLPDPMLRWSLLLSLFGFSPSFHSSFLLDKSWSWTDQWLNVEWGVDVVGWHPNPFVIMRDCLITFYESIIRY